MTACNMYKYSDIMFYLKLTDNRSKISHAQYFLHRQSTNTIMHLFV